MNRDDLVSYVAKRIQTDHATAQGMVEAVLAGIEDALVRKDEVRLARFGSFFVVAREARTGRNPQTGQPMEIAASDAVRFKASKALKDNVNAGKQG